MRERARRADVTPERAALVREVVALVAIADAASAPAPDHPVGTVRRRSA